MKRDWLVAAMSMRWSDPWCTAGTWCRQDRRTRGWLQSHWVPLCEQSAGGRQRQEEDQWLQLQPLWYVPCATESLLAWVFLQAPGGSLVREPGTVVVAGVVSQGRT